METTSHQIMEHKHPLVDAIVRIQVDDPSVWKPYSAYHLAECTFPIALQAVKKNHHQPLITDIGTGSGVLPILAKYMIPNAVCVGSDLNAAAVTTAKKNWELNGFARNEFTGVQANGIDQRMISLLRAQGGTDILIANLPQQPLVNGEDLTQLRRDHAAAWNVDPSRDPDGLGIFMSVMSNSHLIMREGGIAVVSASSKQNKARLTNFLNGLANEHKIRSWSIVSTTYFDIPESYDRHLITHWLAMEKRDGIQRIFPSKGTYQYAHYNVAMNY